MAAALGQDVKYGLRMLRKSPGFTVVAVLTLALGIGATTAIFSVIDAVLLHPIEVKNIDRLVDVSTIDTKTYMGPGSPRNPLSFPNFKDVRAANTVFSAMSAFMPTGVTLTGRGTPERVFAMLVSANYFDVLGVRAVLGRTFLPGEDAKPGGNAVAVLGYALWQRRFGGDPRVIGKAITLNDSSYTIVGVAQSGFNTTFAFAPTDIVYIPLSMYAQALTGPSLEWFNDRRFLGTSTVAQLKPGVSSEQAEASLKVIASHLAAEYPTDNQGRSFVLSPLADAALGVNQARGFMLAGGVLLGVAGLVLLIACVNLAGLLLARSLRREREFVVRTALGASPARLVGQMLTESAVLALIGGALGLAVAWGGKTALWALRPAFLANAGVHLAFNGRVLAFTGAVALFTALLFGFAPALRIARADWSEALKSGSRGSSALAGRTRMRSALVVAEVALAVVVLTLAGLFARSFERALSLNVGFDAPGVSTMGFNLGSRHYTPGQGQQFYQQVIDRVSGLPGVTGTAISSNGIFGGGFARTIFREGEQPAPGSHGEHGSLTLTNMVSPNFFQVMRIPLLKGRLFTDGDRQGSAPVAIANQAMAKQLWPGQDPIGKRFSFFGDTTLIEVVGVVGDTVVGQVGEPPAAQVYQPLLQNYTAAGSAIVRSSVPPGTVIATVRGAIQSLDPDLAITNANTAQNLIRQNLWAPRMGAGLLGLFALLAVVLASVGLYGVLAYSVSQRTGEIGLRMALGAAPGDVFGLILTQGGRLAGIGLLLGLGGAFAAGHVVESLLVGVSGADPLTFAGVIVGLGAVALLACYVPALRATRVAPVQALRYE
ncbi:MAG: ABC transporter permease [Acidobacteriota bacterium]|nr:ABC transporter permease [Acidobacteriota bacterium]